MKIVIPGGTGQIGILLARAFVADGHEVVVLSRSPGKASWRGDNRCPAAHNAVGLAGESPAVGIDCLST